MATNMSQNGSKSVSRLCQCFLLVLCSSLGGANIAAAELEQVAWGGTPIDIHVKTGGYQLVVFPYEVDIDVPVEIASILRAFITQPGYVVFNPTQSFGSAIVKVTRIDGSASMLLNVVASPEGGAFPLHITDGIKNASAKPPSETTIYPVPPKPEYEEGNPPRISLIRHASQSLYAPARLVPVSGGIARVPVSPIAPKQPIMQSQNGEFYSYSVLAGWSGFGLFVTALEIRNESDLVVKLDPRLLRYGGFNGVSFQHQVLSPAGSIEDRTTIYLTSAKPFSQALSEMHYVWRQ